MYSLLLKKGNMKLEFITTNKDVIEKHLALVIHEASKYSKKAVKENPQENISTEQEISNNPKPSHDIIIEPIPPFKLEEEVAKNINNNITDNNIEEKSEITSPVINEPAYIPNTINSIQNPELAEEANFDKILNNKMEQEVNDAVLKDSRFIEFIESKSAIEKIDFLVTTAQYLAQYENSNTFNLKHVNAKLMQNFTIIVDHTVLQSAMSKGYITKIIDNNEDGSGAYMLTEKGLRSY